MPPAQPASGALSWRPPFLLAVAVASAALGGIIQRRPLVRRLAVGALLGTHFSLGVWMIRPSPSPLVDVFVFQRDSAAALREGSNPYSITFPNIYGNSEFYGPNLVVVGRLMFGAPYPPVGVVAAFSRPQSWPGWRCCVLPARRPDSHSGCPPRSSSSSA